MESKIRTENRKATRHHLVSAVEFIVEGEVIDAATVDISQTGLRINTEEPLALTLRFIEDDQKKVYKTRLVWASKKEDGGMTYGLNFIEAL
jgi:hypothetical protein